MQLSFNKTLAEIKALKCKYKEDVNAFGQIVGMNTMIQGPEVSFAIPAGVIQSYVDDVLTQGVPDTQAASYQPDDDVTLV